MEQTLTQKIPYAMGEYIPLNNKTYGTNYIPLDQINYFNRKQNERTRNYGNLNNTKNLIISGLEDEDIINILNSDGLKGLVTLDLSYNKLRLIPNLQRFEELETLIVKNNKINYLTSLDKNIKLKKLDVSHNQFNFICSIGHLKNLEELILNNNPFDIAGLRTVKNYIKEEKFPKLKYLNLSGNSVNWYSVDAHKIKNEIEKMAKEKNIEFVVGKK